jgi:hypothetical protein
MYNDFINNACFMKSKKNFINIIFIFVSFLIYAYIFERNNQLYLLNPTDEFSFKYLIQSTKLNNFDYSSPLYIFIYKIIFVFDENFYKAAKILNLFFYFLGNIFILIIAKKIISINLAKIIFLISSISTFNIYSSSLMPEIFFYMYFYFFIYCYIFLKDSFLKYTISGANIFILFCIKGTGIFLLPAIIINESILYYKNRQKLRDFLKSIIFILFSFFIFFIILKFFITNSSNSFFGSKYQNIFKEISDFKEFVFVLNIFLKNYLGQIYYNFFIFGLPFILFFLKLFGKREKARGLEFFPFLIIVIISIFSSLNHAMYVFSFPNELDTHRLNTRYYDYILPLILISVYQFQNYNFSKNTKLKVTIYLITILLFFFAIFTQINNFRPTFVIFDSILLRGYVYNDIFFNIFITTNILIIISYLFFNFESVKVYIFGYVPLIIILSSIPITKEINTYSKPNIYDQVGNHIKNNKHLFGKNFTIVSDIFTGEDYRVLFNLEPKEIKKIKTIDIKNFISNNTNIFLIDNEKKYSEFAFSIFMDGRYVYIR